MPSLPPLINATSLRCFSPDMSWQRCFDEARRCGYEGVELNFDGRISLDCATSELNAIRQCAREHHLRIVSVYSRLQWQTPLTSADADRRQRAIATLTRLIEIANHLEAPSVLTIPGAVDNSLMCNAPEIVPYEDALRRARDILGDLSGLAQRQGVILALENVANRFLLSPIEFLHVLNDIGSPFVGCHFDVANCLYLHGVPQDWIRLLGTHIRAVHLKDYRESIGTLDGFCAIFEGDVCWPAVCRELAVIGFDGPLISEVLPACAHHPEILWKSTCRAIEALRMDIKRNPGP